MVGPRSLWSMPLVAALRGGGEEGEDRKRKKQRKKKPLLRTYDEIRKDSGRGKKERVRLPPAAQSALKAGRIENRCG